jgi:hypothetical protein
MRRPAGSAPASGLVDCPDDGVVADASVGGVVSTTCPPVNSGNAFPQVGSGQQRSVPVRDVRGCADRSPSRTTCGPHMVPKLAERVRLSSPPTGGGGSDDLWRVRRVGPGNAPTPSRSRLGRRPGAGGDLAHPRAHPQRRRRIRRRDHHPRPMRTRPARAGIAPAAATRALLDQLPRWAPISAHSHPGAHTDSARDPAATNRAQTALAATGSGHHDHAGPFP